MAQTFFKVLPPREALGLLIQVEPVGTESIAAVRARHRVRRRLVHPLPEEAGAARQAAG